MLPQGIQLRPASFIVSAAYLQRAGILHAGRTSWTESNGYNQFAGSSGNLVGALTREDQTPPLQPRSVWWAIKAYADLAVDTSM